MSELPLIFDLMTEEQKDLARSNILDGKCPWCGPKVWRSVGLHLARKHQILAVDARDGLGIPPWVPLNSAQLSERRSEMIRSWEPWNDAQGKQVAGKKTKRLTSYTRSAQRDAARKRSDEYAETRAPRHGTLQEYRKYKCRCEQCRSAQASEMRLTRSRLKAKNAEAQNG